MPHITIKHKHSGTVLAAGNCRDVRALAEQAIAMGLSLRGADLRMADLGRAMLDGADLREACLDGANLISANLSEARLCGASIRDAALQDGCLCFAELRGCDFSGSLFGATDIAGAVLDRCHFTTLSAFTLNFRDAESLGECSAGDDPVPFSRPPVVISGLVFPVILLDRHIRIGNRVYLLDDLKHLPAAYSVP